MSAGQGFALAVFVAALVAAPPQLRHFEERHGPAAPPDAETEAARRRVPDFARAIGHEEMWKKHDGCS